MLWNKNVPFHFSEWCTYQKIVLLVHVRYLKYLLNFLEKVFSHICRSGWPEWIIWTNRMINRFWSVVRSLWEKKIISDFIYFYEMLKKKQNKCWAILKVGQFHKSLIWVYGGFGFCISIPFYKAYRKATCLLNKDDNIHK